LHHWSIKLREMGERAEFDLGVTLRSPAALAGING